MHKLLAGLFLFLILNTQAYSAEKVNYFNGTLKEALKESAKLNKPVFLKGYTTWCGFCLKLERTTLSDAEVTGYLNKNYINLNVDLEKGEGAEIARIFNVTVLPTMLVIASDGAVNKRIVGYQNPGELIEKLR